jgi:energy-coupling factor transporter ATP-binding protein EcfA2
MTNPTYPAIELEGVARRFGERAVLRGLDLQVRPGQIHALLGRNGSGKTTALRILLGFLAPHAGRSSIRARRRDAVPLPAPARAAPGLAADAPRTPRTPRAEEPARADRGDRLTRFFLGDSRHGCPLFQRRFVE